VRRTPGYDLRRTHARPARNRPVFVEATAVLVLALVLALATPAPAPQPTATNPFTLAPIPATPYPLIGTTRSKPVCAALRSAVAPAVQAAMKNDRVYTGLRQTIFNYVVKDSDSARDLRIVQMDRKVDDMVKYVDALEQASKHPALSNAKASPEDAKMLKDLRESLAGMVATQKVQLEAMSGFVETERARRFGTPDESMRQMMAATTNTVAGAPSPPPITGFLNDAQTTVLPQHQTVQSLADAHKLDRDLGDIASANGAREDRASKVIIAAANSCK
jgi:hypothetical protein